MPSESEYVEDHSSDEPPSQAPVYGTIEASDEPSGAHDRVDRVYARLDGVFEAVGITRENIRGLIDRFKRQDQENGRAIDKGGNFIRQIVEDAIDARGREEYARGVRENSRLGDEKYARGRQRGFQEGLAAANPVGRRGVGNNGGGQDEGYKKGNGSWLLSMLAGAAIAMGGSAAVSKLSEQSGQKTEVASGARTTESIEAEQNAPSNLVSQPEKKATEAKSSDTNQGRRGKKRSARK